MAWQNDKLKEAHKELVDKVIKDMEDGKVFFWDSQHFGRPPRNIQSKKVNGKETRSYHGKNKFILGVTAMMKGYTDSRWGTYENIKAAGGQVRKGEKATLIELWLWDKPVRHKNPRTGKWETVYQKDDKGNFVLDRQGKKMPKMIHLDSPIVKGYPVFNVEQADGLQLEPEHQVTISEADRQVKMEAIISGSEAVIYNDQTNSNYYSPIKDEIHVMKREDFKTLSGYYSTVTHEIAHSTGAENRLNRENLTKGEGFGSVSYAKEELVAEMTSMFLAQEFDIKFDESHYENHAAYLQGWISVLKDNPDEMYKAAEQAEKAVTYIKEHMLEKGKALDYKENKAQAVAEENEEYKYYMDRRPISPGAVPKGFTRFDEDDFGGRYGAIYYRGKLTDKQVADYELIPAWERDKTICKAELAGDKKEVLDPKEKLLKELEKAPVKGLAKGA